MLSGKMPFGSLIMALGTDMGLNDYPFMLRGMIRIIPFSMAFNAVDLGHCMC
jgi:hypothetical protein